MSSLAARALAWGHQANPGRHCILSATINVLNFIEHCSYDVLALQAGRTSQDVSTETEQVGARFVAWCGMAWPMNTYQLDIASRPFVSSRVPRVRGRAVLLAGPDTAASVCTAPAGMNKQSNDTRADGAVRLPPRWPACD